MALTYLQSPTAEKIGLDCLTANASPRPTGISSRPIICSKSQNKSIVAAFAQPVGLTMIAWRKTAAGCKFN
uniref:Uncharacterized protein n=1 Tax=Manihot esculenta TaxID=3983 RepID=A0A199UC43_MANES